MARSWQEERMREKHGKEHAMIDARYALAAILVMGLVTFALRALPFIAAFWLERSPLVRRLGTFLPPAIMALLLVHSAAGASREHVGGPWFEIAAIVLTMALQWRSRNALLSILAGTGVYTLLRNAG